jgi:hypothetical protein
VLETADGYGEHSNAMPCKGKSSLMYIPAGISSQGDVRQIHVRNILLFENRCVEL